MSGSRIETYVNFLSFNLDEKTAGQRGNLFNAYFENTQRLNTYYFFEQNNIILKIKQIQYGVFFLHFCVEKYGIFFQNNKI